MKNMGADNETGAGDHPLAGMTLERGKPIAGQIVSRLIGLVTSGGFGYTAGKTIALAYLPTKTLTPAPADLELEAFDKRYAATLHSQPLYDPERNKLLDREPALI